MHHGTHSARGLILVVDDHLDSREGLAEYLRFAGFGVAVATDGLSAVAVALELRPDVILMDLKLRGLDGWEVTRRLKTSARTRHVPILAVSACVFAEDIDAARRVGCAAFVAKPFDLRELVAAIEQAMSPDGFPRFVEIRGGAVAPQP